MDEVLAKLKPYSKCKLSTLSSLELYDALNLLDRYSLDYRDKLSFRRGNTFGVEIEFEGRPDIVLSYIPKFWVFHEDYTVKGGGEVVSPILRDKKDTWKTLGEVTSILETHASVGRTTSLHVHVGAQVLGGKVTSWTNFILLWAVYENIIYRFSYGEYLNYRDTIRYSMPISKYFYNDYLNISSNNYSDPYKVLNIIKHDRSKAINLGNVHDFNKVHNKNTIEFRCSNGTFNPIIIQNNINLFMNMLYYSRSKSFNSKIILDRYKMVKGLCLDDYNKIYLDEAVEFSDLVFSKNIDKLYFLRQYLKGYQVSNDYVKASVFTKKR